MNLLFYLITCALNQVESYILIKNYLEKVVSLIWYTNRNYFIHSSRSSMQRYKTNSTGFRAHKASESIWSWLWPFSLSASMLLNKTRRGKSHSLYDFRKFSLDSTPVLFVFPVLHIAVRTISRNLKIIPHDCFWKTQRNTFVTKYNCSSKI